MSNQHGIDSDPTASAASGAAVTPSDTAALPMTRAVYVGGTGNLAVQLWRDTNPVLLVSVQAGTLLPIRIRKVLETGTTATSIIALY